MTKIEKIVEKAKNVFKSKMAKQFTEEAKNEFGKYDDRWWVKHTGMNSLYVLSINRIVYSSTLDSIEEDILLEVPDMIVGIEDFHLHYCGYVGIPKKHPLYKKVGCFGGTSWEIDNENGADLLNVHGGVTFTGMFSEWRDDFFFIGIDGAHMSDACSLKEITSSPSLGTFKNFDYMETKVIELYDQLSQIESNIFISNQIRKERYEMEKQTKTDNKRSK